MPIDNVLRLYSETIKSSYLHYGYWDDPNNIQFENMTLKDIKYAQERYIENLSTFIPKNVKTILDVGCGIGGNAEYLINHGYSVETLSPDDYQKKIVFDKFNGKVVFHHSKFEEFESEKKYDLILQSESACYIDIDSGFSRASKVLKDRGYILASDYFVHYNDNSNSPHLQSSHDMKSYLGSAKKFGFNLINECDQTENTIVTLDYGKYFLDRFIHPIIDYAAYSAKKNYPKVAGIMEKVILPKFESKKKQLELIDSKLFRKYRKYMIYLFRKL